ncbi:MAG TPA: glycosyltransferase [Candidatus Binatia bacterium]|nr:glycosyltransferase [Candidatus Binatia bacterium]
MKVNPNPLAERYAINGHRVILYAGTFEPYQGLDLLVDASAEVVKARRDVRFLCAGGNEKQVNSIKVRANQRRVADYFIFPGLLPPEEVEFLLKIAFILISPRAAGTNTPLKIYSYLRSGVPILATKIVSHTQVLTDDVALLVEPCADALSAGILKLLDDADLRERLAQNARRLAEESYSPEAYRRKVAEVFTFLAARSQGRV